ncbi:MAG: thioredoxin family protein [Gammaproteobacteria bacterium]
MVSTRTPSGELGSAAPPFALMGVDGVVRRLDDCRGERGTLVMFICNHCPYVRAILDRLLRDCRDLLAFGVRSVAIMSNDPTDYPEDGFGEMQAIARRLQFPFPYLFDETQAVARAYGAVCTPDFFGYDARLELRYRGRLDASGKAPAAPDADRELFEAMRLVAATGRGPALQNPGIGCSIKWRADT